MLFKGNVVISNTKQIDHRWELERITVTILNIHDGGTPVTGPLERLGPKDVFVRAGGTVVRATKGFITPGQDQFHVTVLYDREGHAYPHDIWITLDGNIQQPQNNSPHRVGSVPPTTNNGPQAECTNIATCCADLQRRNDEAIAPISRPPFSGSVTHEGQKQIIANAKPIGERLQACRHKASMAGSGEPARPSDPRRINPHACPPNCGPANSREGGSGYKFDAQGNFVGSDPRGQTDPAYCKTHAKGAVDLDNCWRLQHGERPVNKKDMGRMPEGWQGSGSGKPNCPGYLGGPALDSCRNGDSSGTWSRLPNQY
jgi:hypothetical protein